MLDCRWTGVVRLSRRFTSGAGITVGRLRTWRSRLGRRLARRPHGRRRGLGRRPADHGPDDGDVARRSGDDGRAGWVGGGVRGKRFFIRAVLRTCGATPAQERVIGAAVEEFRDEVKKLGGGEGRRSREEIADALRRPTFDGVVLGEQFARHDTVIEEGRKAFVGLVARVHDALEPEQRDAPGRRWSSGARASAGDARGGKACNAGKSAGSWRYAGPLHRRRSSAVRAARQLPRAERRDPGARRRRREGAGGARGRTSSTRCCWT